MVGGRRSWLLAAVRLLLATGVSAVILWWIFRDVHWQHLWRQIVEMDLTYVGLYALALVVVQLCRVWRWQPLIKSFVKLTPRELFRISNIGLFLILALPFRLGEFSRPYLLKKHHGVRMSMGMGSVVVERVIDGLLVTVLFFLSTLALDGRFVVPHGIYVAAFIAGGIFAVAIAVIVVTLVFGEPLFRLLELLNQSFVAPLTRRVTEMLRAFTVGLKSLPDWRAILVFCFWTLVYWGANGLGLYWMMCAFGWDLPKVAGFILVSIIVVGIMIPAGPGHLGTYQGAIVKGLAIFAVAPTDAAAYSMVVYPLNVLVVVLFGLPYLVNAKLQISELVESQEELATR